MKDINISLRATTNHRKVELHPEVHCYTTNYVNSFHDTSILNTSILDASILDATDRNAKKEQTRVEPRRGELTQGSSPQRGGLSNAKHKPKQNPEGAYYLRAAHRNAVGCRTECGLSQGYNDENQKTSIFKLNQNPEGAN